MATADRSFWESQRKQMLLDPEKTQLNNGSFAPLPIPVARRMSELHRQVACGPSDFYWRRQPPLLDAARLALAEYLYADPLNLLMLFNTTIGVNLVAASLELPAGSEILMTDQEYGACKYCWLDFAARRGWTVREAPIPTMPDSADEIVDALAKAIGPKTKVLFFSHVTSPTGLMLPAAKLCQMARQRGLLSVIDGAHAPAFGPLNVNAVDADFYIGNCHKWLLAPSGSAFMVVRPEHKAMLRPLIISWGWDSPRDQPDFDSGWGGSHWQRYIEFQGTIDRCPQIVVPEAIAFRREIGEERIEGRVVELSNYVRSGMKKLGFDPATPSDRTMSGTLAAFHVPAVDVVKARNWIWETHGIECPFTTSADKFHIRVSTPWYCMEEDYDKLFAAMATFEPATLGL